MDQSIYSVKQLNSYIKNALENDPFLMNVTVQGEVGNCNYNRSGHIYFSIKENTDVINCVMFKSQAAKLKFRIEPGQQIIIKGRIGVYEAQGKYQLYASEIEPAGLGDLYKKYEKLKAELEERGLFAEMYKKTIPKYSLNIGVATSETGAVINDIINVTSRRNKYVQLYLKPTMVQGELAAQSIVNSIRCLDQMDLDVIIVGRGGGSLEDLWCFNEEIVAQAIFDCKTPIISAVGHETDFSISDFVADLIAPTPSAAAEIAVFEFDEFENNLERYKLTFKNYIDTKIENYRNKTKVYETSIEKFSPMSKVNTYKQLISEYRDKMSYAFNDKFAEARRLVPDFRNRLSITFDKKFSDIKHRLQILAKTLEGLSPLEKISHGFAYVSGPKGALVSTKDVEVGDNISLIIKDGKIDAEVSGKQDGEQYGKE